MKPVIWPDKATDDLKSIHAYIAKDNPAAARNVLSTIIALADTLSYHPEIGRLGRVDGTRELVIDNLPYIVVYEVMADGIYILAVIHASRKWPEGF